MVVSKQIEDLVLSKAKIKRGTTADNIKLGEMGSWAMLFGSCNWYVPELDLWIQGTCGQHCKGCFDPENERCSRCYVAKSYVKYTKRNEDGSIGDIIRNKCSVKLGHAYRTIAMTMFPDKLLESLDNQLKRMKNKLGIVRINESGELTSYKDLKLWAELSNRHPETIFYLYTKNYKVIKKAVNNGIIPNNLFINISIWHKSGIKEYMEMKDHSQIRAFVLVDNEWTKEKYLSYGLDITSMCGAYNKEGKMNHEVTCDKCKKCFSRVSKCTGCYEH